MLHEVYIKRVRFSIRETVVSVHVRTTCTRSLEEMEAEVLDNLIESEESVSRETMLSIVYIAGYIELHSENRADDTMFYYQKYSDYFDALDRGSLKKPSDSVVQWTVYCYIFFTQMMDRSRDVCGTLKFASFSNLNLK